MVETETSIALHISALATLRLKSLLWLPPVNSYDFLNQYAVANFSPGCSLSIVTMTLRAHQDGILNQYALANFSPGCNLSIVTMTLHAHQEGTPVYRPTWMLCCFHSLISTQTFQRASTASVDCCTEIKGAPSVV